MSRGIVMFAVNNSSIDYVQLAVMAAAFIKCNMPGTDVCLITDQASLDWHDSHSQWKTSRWFTHVVLLPPAQEQFDNTRCYRDTRYWSVHDRFRNETRSLAYDLSPFDQTLLLDSDYLQCSNVLSAVWDSAEEIMINRRAVDLSHTPLAGPEFRLNPYGIRMYWATAVYFKKGPAARQLFDLVQHIKQNWEFYKLTYDFPGELFRNDYAFSIAIHILNGFCDGGGAVADLPDPSIITARDTDQFFRLRGGNSLSFFMNDQLEQWKFTVNTFSGVNVHCMNKLSLINSMDHIMGALDV